MKAWSTRVNAALMLGLLLLQWVNVATMDNDIVSQVSWTVSGIMLCTISRNYSEGRL